MTHARTWLTLAGCGIVFWGGFANAQTFYKWTDDAGTVHFSDVPPANVKNVEERSLPPAPAAPANPPEGTSEEAKEEAKAPAANEGPARVVLVSKHAPRTGPSGIHISGEVKNVGGAEARSVSIIVTAVDSTAGTPCLHQEVSVTPSTLRSGETGTFDAEINDPCLSGGTPIDIATSSD